MPACVGSLFSSREKSALGVFRFSGNKKPAGPQAAAERGVRCCSMSIGVPNGSRTHVRSVRGCCPRPLDDRDVHEAEEKILRPHSRRRRTATVRTFEPKQKVGYSEPKSEKRRTEGVKTRKQKARPSGLGRAWRGIELFWDQASAALMRLRTLSFPIRQSVTSIWGVRSAAQTTTRSGVASTFIEIPCSSITAWMQ